MAGEGQATPTTYNDISSGKVVNKEGLLELCGQIKTAIASAGGSSGSSSSQQPEYIVVLPSKIDYPYNTGTSTSMTSINSNYQTLFNTYYNEMASNPIKGQQKYLTYLASDSSITNQIIPYNETFISTNTNSLCQVLWLFVATPLSVSGSNSEGSFKRQNWLGLMVENNLIWTMGFTMGWHLFQPINSDDIDLRQTSLSTMYGLGLKTGFFKGKNTLYEDFNAFFERSLPTFPSANGTYMLVDTVSNGTSTKSWATVPSGGASLPTDPSNDGSYILQNTISSGTSTLSWTTPPSSGTTYTAGTGISITNGVISLDLANASQEAM